MLKLCPRCGGVMKPRRESNRSILVCTRCGYRIEVDEKTSIKISSRIQHSSREKMIVLDEDIDVSKLPITRDVTCKRCGAHEAYYWMIQTRAADEPPTRFYKCTKCGYVWREYE